jgi:peptidoglycan/LPS O-acetylase OafA/YrhL
MHRYIPELDGLRAIAIISVMLFHLGLFPIGWMGVPLFFVLSGYLITSILHFQRHDSLKNYLGVFYWRRTVRIFPLYYGYLALNAVAALANKSSLDGYWWFLTYLGNYRIGALSPTVPGGIIGHLWSLSVEEQFYLIWPLAIFFVRRPAWVAAMIIIAAPLLRETIFRVSDNPYMTIVTLPSCLDMLGAGALVALVPDRRLFLAMECCGAAIVAYCFAVIPISHFALTPLWVGQAHIIYTGLALLFAPLIATASKIAALSWTPLRLTGRISYGLYMWHLLVFTVVHKAHLNPMLDAAISLTGAFVVATLSWIFFERPILALKGRTATRSSKGEEFDHDHMVEGPTLT